MIKSVYVYVCLMMLAAVSLASCKGDDAYKEENAAYFNEKMAEKGADGELLYKQVEYNGYKALYRVIKKEGNDNTRPQLDTRVTMTLKGDQIDGKNFQPEGEYTFVPKSLIPGLAQVMLQTSIGETVETIIPAALGYGDSGRGPIPGGSTLIFTYTMLEYK